MAKTIIITVRLSSDIDNSVIEKISAANSVSGYIKSLIAKDIGTEYSGGITFSSGSKKLSSNDALHISLNPDTDSKIIDKLKSVTNKSDYIRTLVSDDINSVKSKSFDQLAEEINLSEYTSMAQFAASQFSELADILRSNGFLAKASECTKLVDMLNSWAMNVK